MVLFTLLSKMKKNVFDRLLDLRLKRKKELDKKYWKWKYMLITPYKYCISIREWMWWKFIHEELWEFLFIKIKK